MDTLTVKPSEVTNIVGRAMKANRPIFIWGPPGVGKSELVENITYNVLPGNNLMIDMRLALMEPTDLRGYPFRNPETNQMEWAPAADLPTAEQAELYDHIVLFLDELNSAPPSVQAAAYQLVLNGKIGQYVLPKNVKIVAAGNRETDRGVTFRMPAPLANRFRHINIAVDFGDWQQWAVNNNVHPDVIGYLSFAKQDLFDFDPKSSSQAFATPRSWVFTSDMLYVDDFDTASPKEQKAEVAGAIGEGMAIKFLEHRKIASALPKPSDIIAGDVAKLQDKVAKEISAKYSLVVSLAYELKGIWDEDDEKVFGKAINNALKFTFDNFEPEMVVFFLRTIMHDYKIMFNLRTTIDKDLQKIFRDKYVKYIT